MKKEQDVYLKNFLQVRLVSNFNKSKVNYEQILGFQVDQWGHAERGKNVGFILQQAENPDDVRPNAKPNREQWKEQTVGWDSYFYSNFDGVGTLFEEFNTKGALFAYEPKVEIMGNSKWMEFAVKDLDGYVMVFGGGN